MELVSYKKHKTIKAGTFLKIGTGTPDQDPCNECPAKQITGRLIKYAEGVLTLQVSSLADRPSGDSAHYYTEQFFSSHFVLPTMEVQKDDVTNITVKGKHKNKKYATGESIGYLIAMIGLGHLVSAPIAGEDEAGLLIGLGLAEFCGGILLASTIEQPHYSISQNCDKPKQVGNQTWVIK